MFKELGDELADFIAWLKEKLADTDVRREIALDLGLQPGESVPDPDLPKDKLDSIERYRSQANPDREAFFILLNDVRSVWEAMRAFIRSLGVSEITALNETVYRLFEILASNYFRLRHPKVYFAAQLLDAMAEDTSAIDASDYTIERFFRSLARVEEFLLSPIGYLFKSLWFGVQDEAEARRVSERTFTHLAAFLVMAKSFDAVSFLATNEVILGWDSLIKADPSPDDQKTPKADEISERMLSFAFVRREKDKDTGRDLRTAINFSLAIVPQSHGGSGFFISVGGGGEVTAPLSDKWKLRAEFSSPSSAAFLIQKDLQNKKWLFSADGPNEARAILSVATTPDQSGVTYKIPSPDETRAELGQLAFSIVLAADKTELKASAKDCALVLVTKDNDGFIGSLIPDDGMRIPINFGVGYSEANGFYTEGNIPFLSGRSAPADDTSRSFSLTAASEPSPPPRLSGGNAPQLGLQQIIPVGRSLGPVMIQQVLIGVFPVEDPASQTVALEVSSSLNIKLGPVLATVDRIGFQFKLGFPLAGGNMGFADLSLGVKTPEGIGLVIDAPTVTGGGFLRFEPQKQEYSGILQLEIAETISVKAIGLLTTRMPDGGSGYSLVIVIAAEGFAPIQLGFGFTLTGIGGLLGVNRTVAVDVLRGGIKNGTLGSVLFPADPIRNAPQIVSDLRTVFPPARNRYVFGPMALIEWGTPTILTLELALILELPEPVRLIILGRLRADLPDADHALIRVRMDAIGVIDFNREEIALDATLYDSRILEFVLSGDMALRANWGRQPDFVLAVGGFNPRYPVPAGFPRLERLALSLSDNDNPRLRFESYLALTSNTVQFGGRLDFAYSASGFTLAGFLGMDALFQFEPFAFIADIGAMVALKRGSRTLMGIALDMTLAGPTPWHVWGKATFKILFFKVKIGFDHRFGHGEPPPLPAPVDAAALLAEALGDRRNWSGALPKGEPAIVTLRESTTLRLHPLAELSVRQRVVPLNRPVSRFGNAPLAGGATTFTVAVAGGLPVNFLQGAFAPAQYQDLSDDEKLAQPAFEQYDAGLQFGADALAYEYDAAVDSAIAYETLIVDPTRPAERQTEPYAPTATALDAVIDYAAAAQAPIRRRGAARYRNLEQAA